MGYNFNSTTHQIDLGGSASKGVLNSTADVDVTAVGNVGAGEDDLITYSLPANSMDANNRAVRIHAWGTLANNANAKTVKMYFGATAILTLAMPTNVAMNWEINATVVRTGASTQDAIASMINPGTPPVVDREITTPAEDTTGAITIKCTGEATANDDIVQEGMVTEFLN